MKNRRARLVLAYMIGLMPTSKVRCFLYRRLFKYKIYQSYLGWASVLAVDSAELIACSIGSRNKFIGPMRVVIGKDASIGSMNVFNCGWWAKAHEYESASYDCRLEIGMNTLITSNHYFDVVGSFVLGNYSWVAGAGSQFWTHGAGVQDRNVAIGAHCYVGSAVRFAPGSSVGENCLVGLGSVVTKQIAANNAVIAGHPARVIRENYDWKTRTDIC